jgi:hypothetical protein
MSLSSRFQGLLVSTAALATLLGVGSPTPAPGATPVELPSFACYEPKLGGAPSRSVRVADDFGVRNTTLGAAVGICSAVSLNGRASSDAAANLLCHVHGDRRAVSTRVELSNAYGRTRVDVVGEQSLCVPASVATGGPLAGLPNLDAFSCYAARQGREAERKVIVSDRFGRSDDLLAALTSVCMPVSVDGSRTLQRRLLACYRLTSSTRSRSAVVRSRFALLKATSGQRRYLCVPSTRR